MNQSSITLIKILTYSGTLPLIASIGLIYVPIANMDSNLIAQTYSAIIISFLCGIHWSAHLFLSEKCPRYFLVTSNLVALIAWGSLFLGSQQAAFLVQIGCFLSLLALDLKLRDADILPDWFYKLRRNATSIVAGCLLIMTVIS